MSKRAREENELRVEKHDSGFMGPLAMFATFPHNATFEESREVKINASPVNADADVYTFVHHNQPYGILRTEDATIRAKMRFRNVAGPHAVPAAGQIIAPLPLPLRLGWKSKEVHVNGDLIQPITAYESELNYVNYLLTRVPSGYNGFEKVCLGYLDTPGHMDDRTRIDSYTEATCVNKGAGRRGTLFDNGAENYVIDDIDLLGHNRRYLPSSMEIKVVLTRLEKVKYIFGTTADAQAAKMELHDLHVHIPVFKPVAQLAEAINESMIQKSEECKFYTTNYRYVAKPMAAGAQRVQWNDMFNGARPARTIVYVKTQARYNGAHQLNPNLMAFPDINQFAIKINEAIVPPEIHNSQEAYVELRRVLDRRYSEMPFSYDDYVSSYGMIVSDLTTNKDSYNQMLPNSTSGIVSLDMTFTQATGADQQLICIGEFRNQLNLGYHTRARNKYDY
ncbi:Hypothetical predicted protein [Paramuricea clavata]|uniref:Uncharacterized protein n=1 Tax=Paramuricea clavata TaxID=317549 RepID=A0A7D9JBD0_PARCT|nr:Hypothetical predicted protein [Paramuricea clavata]